MPLSLCSGLKNAVCERSQTETIKNRKNISQLPISAQRITIDNEEYTILPTTCSTPQRITAACPEGRSVRRGSGLHNSECLPSSHLPTGEKSPSRKGKLHQERKTPSGKRSSAENPSPGKGTIRRKAPRLGRSPSLGKKIISKEKRNISW